MEFASNDREDYGEHDRVGLDTLGHFFPTEPFTLITITMDMSVKMRSEFSSS